MKFLIAPDKFKDCLSAADAADCIASGIRSVISAATLDVCPIADGGEGTVAAFLAGRSGRFISQRVTGPLPEMKVDASFALLDDGTAVIEMAAASGLALLLPGDRNPLNTTTFGTGELIVAAIRAGARRIILGLGGSATIDAGIGCLQACGFTILTVDGEPTSMTEPLCGRDLERILMVKHGRGEMTAGIEIIAASDVTNPLLGEHGAAQVFGPQKGADPQSIEYLETSLAGLVHRTGTTQAADYPGAGAAGGFGFAVVGFLGGKLQNGFDLIAESLRLRERVQGADLCITGEGRLDASSFRGKAVGGVARLCHELLVPCIALVGSFDSRQQLAPGSPAVFCICPGVMPLDESLRTARHNLQTTAANCARLVSSIRQFTT
jgi:glycerate kinase